MQYNLVPA